MTSMRDTNANDVARAIAEERHRLGASTTGMVLTLIVLTSDADVSEVVSASSWAAREHPMRIIVLVPHSGRGADRIDARISVGGLRGPGETVVLRLRGAVAAEPASVATPLLLPDTPVVAWWAGQAPAAPSLDPVGELAHRRITDTTTADDQVRTIKVQAAGYSPGDTDIAWGELTGWRALLASALDEPYDTLHDVEILAPRDTWAAAGLLGAWLHHRLRISVRVDLGPGPGISMVRLGTRSGDIRISRSDGKRALLSRPGRPDAVLALPHRLKQEVLAEELRRLDADEIYAEALSALGAVRFTETS